MCFNTEEKSKLVNFIIPVKRLEPNVKPPFFRGFYKNNANIHMYKLYLLKDFLKGINKIKFKGIDYTGIEAISEVWISNISPFFFQGQHHFTRL